VVVDVILFQDPAPIVIEIDTHLLPTVDPIVPQYWLATCGSQGEGWREGGGGKGEGGRGERRRDMFEHLS